MQPNPDLIKLDVHVADEAEAVLASLGYTPETVIAALYGYIAREQRLPVVITKLPTNNFASLLDEDDDVD